MKQAERIHDLIIIGAGPSGLEMGLAAAEMGLDFFILEKNGIANNIRSWGHVTLFTPWRMNVSHRGKKAANLKVISPDAVCTGAEYASEYLKPLSESPGLAPHIITGAQVVSIGRKGAYKNTLIGDPKRAELPFRALVDVRSGDGAIQEREYLSRAVIDASGGYGNNRWLGAGGIHCPGERALSSHISYTLEDISIKKNELAGKHLALVGAGYSACTALESFAELIRQGCDLKVSWIVSGDNAQPINLIAGDPLPYRHELGLLANQLASQSRSQNNHWLRCLPGRSVCGIEKSQQGILVRIEKTDSAARETLVVDHIYAMIGYKPDRSLYEELQVHECWATSGPMNLAASLLAQSGVDCLNVESGGPETLQNPEPDFYIIGAKSYGRHSNYLMERVHDQIQIVSDLLAQKLASTPNKAMAPDS